MNLLLFVALPYVAWTLAILGGIWRYRRDRFSYTSASSQILESRLLLWGSVPWHYGIIPILLAHLLVALLPGPAGAVLRHPTARLVLEVAGMSLALLAIFGLVLLIARRVPARSLARPATSAMDWIMLGVLLLTVVTGFLTALFQRWGSLWYLSTAVPWFWSIAKLQPDPAAVSVLPQLMQIHFSLGFTVILLFPFTRLVHLVAVPITYLWRPYQVVVWNGRPESWSRRRPVRSVGAAAAHEPPDEAGRRRFLQRLTVLLAGATALVVGIPSVAFLLGLRKVQPSWIGVGNLERFAPGTTTLVAFADPSPLPWTGVSARTAAWVRRDGGEQMTAFSVNCTHLGCPVRWLPDAELFMCPCHGGVFYKDGRVASGPPQRHLTQYPVRVREGVVEILASPLPIA